MFCFSIHSNLCQSSRALRANIGTCFGRSGVAASGRSTDRQTQSLSLFCSGCRRVNEHNPDPVCEAEAGTFYIRDVTRVWLANLRIANFTPTWIPKW
jgi:hypothetical protein